MTKEAYKVSETYDVPVMIRMTTRVCHSKSLVEEKDRQEVAPVLYQKQRDKMDAVPTISKRRRYVIEEREEKLKGYAESCPFNEIEMNDTKIGIIAAGAAYLYAKEALGDKASYLKLGFTYPLPMETIKTFSDNFDELYVIEELDPFMEEQIRHRKDTVMIGDIGCYALGGAAPLNAKDLAVCMGSAFSVAHGFSHGLQLSHQNKRVVACMGDSTFFHTGINSLTDVAYNGSNAICVILDNRITGMTGHQDNPGSGYTLMGEEAPMLSVEKIFETYGFNPVLTVDPQDLAAMKATVDAAVAALNEGKHPAIVTRRPCLLIKRVKHDTGMCVVNADKCKSCKSCLKVGCPAISMENGKAFIDRTQCVGCTVCAQACPFDAIEKEEK